ncbi:acyltransferase family protein [Abyssalbus ytuae]|uniref:Heparan-alpha-glucosaminide N-acetyltransferase domain-containing protein n=1 Tax=Abyssalbus ytuae TaxID=2926907 RepID=A0A9E6ZS09_9FLAO|nr:heparan-alpha-glucosaminide N-acetyltransferase domain-containing protein [Abyssalbus ytuae]UOB16798.1 heparan-alpha-glucosaminide N-acetyltransferase domain-containing protein [Abyssalbus ytuae]
MKRVQSVDFLRGLTILLMILVNTPGDWSHVYPLLLHAQWNGLTLADFVFPFFLFIVGVSISFVYKKKEKSAKTYKKIFVRSVKLVLLGLFLNAFTPFFPFIETESLRFPGVLQRIGIVFCIASVLYLNLNRKALIITSIFTLIGYWLWVAFIPLPNGSLPTLDRSPDNWANYLDYLLLKGHMWKQDYDPEGILSTIPAIISALSGTIIGEMLIQKTENKFKLLISTGLGLLISGIIWGIFYPVNKALWSSTFVLITSGCGTLILAILYYFMDSKNYNFGKIIKSVGSNAIIIYFLSSILSKAFYMIKVDDSRSLHGWLFENLFVYDVITAKLSSFLYALVVVSFYTLLAFILEKKKIFIKV